MAYYMYYEVSASLNYAHLSHMLRVINNVWILSIINQLRTTLCKYNDIDMLAFNV